MARTFNPETYAQWRATVPFTDGEIADAIEADAAFWDTEYPARAVSIRKWAASIRAGRVSVKSLAAAHARLIKTCAVMVDGAPCGKTALYRSANEGRCKAHKFVPAVHHQRRVARIDAAALALERERKDVDSTLRRRWVFHQAKSRRKKK